MNDDMPLTADQLKAEIDALNQQRNALEQALKQRFEQERIELAAEVKALIDARGHDLDEILGLLPGRSAQRKRCRAVRSASDEAANYIRYADPDNPERIYTRGRMPAWLIEKMDANGFDPADAAHRQQFKSEHLVQLAA